MTERGTPSLPGAGLAVAAALAAVALTAVSPLALLVDAAGVALLGVGLARTVRPAITLATVALFGGVVAAALADAATTTLLGATVAIAVAYSVGDNALSVARDARRAGSARVELVHAASVVALAGAAGVVSYLAYAASNDDGSALGVVALLAGVVLVVVGLGRRE